MGPLVDLDALASLLQFGFSAAAVTITNDSEFVFTFNSEFLIFYFSTAQTLKKPDVFDVFAICLADKCTRRFSTVCC